MTVNWTFIFEATRYDNLNLIKTDLRPYYDRSYLAWNLIAYDNYVWYLTWYLKYPHSTSMFLETQENSFSWKILSLGKKCPAHIMNQIRCDILISLCPDFMWHHTRTEGATYSRREAGDRINIIANAGVWDLLWGKEVDLGCFVASNLLQSVFVIHVTF